jgi:hypothetical protein
VRRSLIRSVIVGAVAGSAAFGGMCLLLLRRAPPDARAAWVIALLISIVGAGVVAFGAAAITFVFCQYPKSARTAAMVATILCSAFSGWFAYEAFKNGKPIEWDLIAFSWVVLFPAGFGVSLWTDVRFAIARKVLDSVRNRTAEGEGTGGPTRG